jgi:hypothetical protein
LSGEGVLHYAVHGETVNASVETTARWVEQEQLRWKVWLKKSWTAVAGSRLSGSFAALRMTAKTIAAEAYLRPSSQDDNKKDRVKRQKISAGFCG